jgi:hypothetical protein
MYSLFYFISHPVDVSNATVSGLIDWIKEEQRIKDENWLYGSLEATNEEMNEARE